MAMESTTRTNKSTIIATDSLSSLLAASGSRWTRNPQTRNIRRLYLDNSRNHIKLICHVEYGENEVEQAAKDALNKEIGNHEPSTSGPDKMDKKKSSITDKKDGKEVKTI
jgi:hypothetical protein